MRGLILSILILLVLFGQVSAQQYDSVYGRPLIFLREMSRFGLLSVHPDIPTFVLYENGQILYTVDRDGDPRIYKALLRKNEIHDVSAFFAITDSFYNLKERIIGEQASDLGLNVIQVNFERAKTVDVYGYLGDKGPARQKTPAEFLKLYDRIRKYRNPNAEEWVPSIIQVFFEPYDDYYVDTLKKKPWLEGFPDLTSPTAKLEYDSTYSVAIEGKKFNEFKSYYSSLDRQKSVEINGKRMIISYRIPFPNVP